jgi:hypothetical protein
VVTDTYIITPTLVNDLTAGYLLVAVSECTVIAGQRAPRRELTMATVAASNIGKAGSGNNRPEFYPVTGRLMIEPAACRT